MNNYRNSINILIIQLIRRKRLKQEISFVWKYRRYQTKPLCAENAPGTLIIPPPCSQNEFDILKPLKINYQPLKDEKQNLFGRSGVIEKSL